MDYRYSTSAVLKIEPYATIVFLKEFKKISMTKKLK